MPKKFIKTGPMKLPSRIAGGTFKLYLYEFPSGNKYFGLLKGKVENKNDILFRINSNCIWSMLFGSARCDCADQLHDSLRQINKEGTGLVIHAYNQDGRGLSIRDHLRAYMEQDKGYDTVEADKRIGFKNPDRRNYDETIQIVKDFKIKSLRMLTNNPMKIDAYLNAGIPTAPVLIESVKIDKFNAAQLYIKKTKMGHMYDFDINDPKIKKLFKFSLTKWSFGEYDGDKKNC